MRNIIRSLLLVGVCLAMPAAAEPDADALRERVERAVLEWIESQGVTATEGEDLALRLDMPEQHVADAGIVFDGTWNPEVDLEGLRIIALRPGGAAARMGLREGDRIVSVNGIDLRNLGETGDGRARAASALSRMVAGQGPGQTLEIAVLRGKEELRVSGPVDSRYLPPIHLALGQAAVAATAEYGVDAPAASTRGCGEISIFATPPRTRDIFPVMIVGINGQEWFSSDRSIWRVPSGTYEVRVVELISDFRLRVSPRLRGVSKTITVTVEPDHVYDIGARFIKEQRLRGAHGDYWEPVVWRSESKTCRRVDFWPRD